MRDRVFQIYAVRACVPRNQEGKGARYNLYKGKKAFFFQPSVGLAVNRTNLQAFLGATPSTATSLIVRAEAGVKFYNRRNNYFVFGLRHQHGLNDFDEHQLMNSTSNPLRIESTSKGSFTGIFIGYGINTGKKNNLD